VERARRLGEQEQRRALDRARRHDGGELTPESRPSPAIPATRPVSRPSERLARAPTPRLQAVACRGGCGRRAGSTHRPALTRSPPGARRTAAGRTRVGVGDGGHATNVAAASRT
jgi:hypothetical protein